MRYAQIRLFDVSNGEAIRLTLFVSGCTHNCEGCFNKEYQDFKYGDIWDDEIQKHFIRMANEKVIRGVSILGGEPLQQGKDMLDLLKAIKHETGKNVWLWTGYTWDEIMSKPELVEMLQYIDVLIDGRFILARRDLRLKWRGSDNQRVIDVKRSLESKEIVEYIC